MANIKKTAVRIITAPIPINGWRKAARKYLLEENKIKKIKIYFKSKLEKYREFKYDFTIAAIAKNEAPYIEEWLAYYINMGCKKFYIYDNESEDNLKEVLEPYIQANLVLYNYMPGEKKQMAAYMDAIEKHKNEAKWMAFIDLDEFIVPMEKETIPEFLKDYDGYPEILVGWLLYGDSGQQSRKLFNDGGELIIESFKMHADYGDKVNQETKAILNPRMVFDFTTPHYAKVIGTEEGFGFDENKNLIKEYPMVLSKNKIRINHYYGKTWEEYEKKKSRGSAYFGSKVSFRNRAAFDIHNKNDMSDGIMEKYINKVKDTIKRYRLSADESKKRKFFMKEFDFICSIGEDCACTSYLRRFNLQEATYPFDWLTKPGLKTRVDCIVDNFNDFLEKKNFKILPKTQKLLDNKNDYYENVALDFYFYHDFPIGVPFEEAFKNFKEKYNRRIKRLYRKIKSGKDILFVWYSKDKILENKLIMDSYRRLAEKFKKQNIHLLVFENDSNRDDIFYLGLDKNVLKVISDFASYDKSDPFNEVMGNVQRNGEVFSQIKFKRSKFKSFLNTIIRKTVKFFCIFIFPKDIRKKVRKKIINKLIIK